jgi:hypothetical protein
MPQTLKGVSMSINTILHVANQPSSMRMVCGRVDVASGTPSVGAGEGFTVVDTAAGQVEIVFTKPGKSIVSAVATALETTDATGHFVKVDAKTEASSVVFSVYAADATDGVLADDVGFYFQVILKDAAV